MAIVSIPLPTSSEPHLVQTTQLEGQSYTFEFNWNSRTDRFTLSIINVDGTRILDGALLGLGYDILRTIPNTLSYVPPGQLVCTHVSDDPRLDNIGEALLFYVEST